MSLKDVLTRLIQHVPEDEIEAVLGEDAAAFAQTAPAAPTSVRTPAAPAATSAESEALLGEEHRQVLAAIRRLPARQREVLVLRFYLDLDEEEIAASMRISRGTVKSTTSRALAALGRILGEQQS